MLRVTTVVGTRPELIRLSRTIALFDEIFEHRLVHTGQNNHPQLSEAMFHDLGIRKPDVWLGVGGDSFAQTMAETILGVESEFVQNRPDAVLVLGDTNSAISILVARRMQIPTYHAEAGNRSFDSNVPEEINRRMVDHTADYNLVYNSYSRRNLLDEGLSPDAIQITGSPLPEVFSFHQRAISESTILEKLGIENGSFILASLHRQENVDDKNELKTALEALDSAAKHFNRPVIMSTHPRTKARQESFGLNNYDNVKFVEPLGYLDYNKMQMNAFCVLSDSGTVSEEASILGFPAVSVRRAHERPESIASAGVINSPKNASHLIRAVEFAIEYSHYPLPEGYEVMNFSKRVAAFILSTAPTHHERNSISLLY